MAKKNKPLDNPELSLVVNPTGRLQLDDRAILFIKLMVEYQNFHVLTNYFGFTFEEVQQYRFNMGVNEEIRRLNMAISVHRTQTPKMRMEEVTSYLSSMILDHNLPEKDKLNIDQKLKAIALLQKQYELIGKIEPENIIEGEVVDVVETERKLDQLTLEELKELEKKYIQSPLVKIPEVEVKVPKGALKTKKEVDDKLKLKEGNKPDPKRSEQIKKGYLISKILKKVPELIREDLLDISFDNLESMYKEVKDLPDSKEN